MATSFSCTRKKMKQGSAPNWACPSAALRATYCAQATGSTAELVARLQRFTRTTTASQFTKRACHLAHPPACCSALLGTGEREGKTNTGGRSQIPAMRGLRRKRAASESQSNSLRRPIARASAAIKTIRTAASTPHPCARKRRARPHKNPISGSLFERSAHGAQ